jgi:uncharacterized Zn finger protein
MQDAIDEYADILGPEGMAEYERFAREKWERRGTPNPWSRDRLAQILEASARASGNIEQLVSVLSADLSSGRRYVEIAEVYRQARQFEKAIEWAERGLREFGGVDPYVRSFAADLYQEAGRDEDALQLDLQEFVWGANLDRFRRLEARAKRAGCWPIWREQAIAAIRKLILKETKHSVKRSVASWHGLSIARTVLVEVLLYEGDAEGAWRESRTGSFPADLVIRVAAARANDHPEDAAPIFLRAAELSIQNGRDSDYGEAVKLLLKARKLMVRMGHEAKFETIAQHLRVKYGAKRNFVQLLDREMNTARAAEGHS